MLALCCLLFTKAIYTIGRLKIALHAIVWVVRAAVAEHLLAAHYVSQRGFERAGIISNWQMNGSFSVSRRVQLARNQQMIHAHMRAAPPKSQQKQKDVRL